MMDWNRIQTQWQSRSDLQAPDTLADLATPERLWPIIRRRDRNETFVSVLGAFFFGGFAVFLLLIGKPVAALFGLWLTLVCVYIPLRLRRARQMIPVPDPGRPVTEFLRAERQALLGQRELLGAVWRWYWGPIAVGVIGFFVGIIGWHWISAAFVAIVVAGSVGIEYLNRMAVRHSIEPAIEAVERQITEMENDHAE